MDLKSDIQEKYYAQYWKKLEEFVSQDSKELEMFFRMFIAIKTYSLVPKNSVYREFMYWVEQSDLKIKEVAEIETVIGSEKSVSYTGANALFLSDNKARKRVIIKVSGTFKAVSFTVCKKASRKSLFDKRYLMLS